MKAIRGVICVTCIGLALLLVLTTTSARAQDCCYFNPLFLPFAVAGAVVGTAAAIVSAPFYPYPAYYGHGYYAPAHGYYGPERRPYYHRQAWNHDRHGPYGPRIHGHGNWNRY